VLLLDEVVVDDVVVVLLDDVVLAVELLEDVVLAVELLDDVVLDEVVVEIVAPPRVTIGRPSRWSSKDPSPVRPIGWPSLCSSKLSVFISAILDPIGSR